MEDNLQEKKRCPHLENPISKECYCVDIHSQTIPDAMNYCSGGHSLECRTYRNTMD